MHKPSKNNSALKILVTGASGFIGQAVCAHFTELGATLTKLTRSRSKSQEEGWLFWDPDKSEIDLQRLEGHDVVIHLAGENIAASRWTASQKRRIRESRVISTSFLSKSLAELESPPKVFISASATGYYGNCGDTEVPEDTYPASTFLARVATEWEGATAAASSSGTRCVIARFGMVLAPNGGALAKMLLPFKLGLGGKLGSGRQYWSWISLHDLVCALQFVIDTHAASGAFNFVSPSPVTNLEFTKALGRALHRPTIIPVPAWALKVALGEMAEALLLSGARVIPKKLLDLGFVFSHPTIDAALNP